MNYAQQYITSYGRRTVSFSKPLRPLNITEYPSFPGNKLMINVLRCSLLTSSASKFDVSLRFYSIQKQNMK